MIVIDTGASYNTYVPDMSVVIPSINPSDPISTVDAYLIGEFGLKVEEPTLPSPPNYNVVQHSATVGIESTNQNGITVRIIVTQTPTDNLSNEEIIFVTEESFLNTNPSKPTQIFYHILRIKEDITIQYQQITTDTDYMLCN